MKAAQIKQYSKQIEASVEEIAIPEIAADEVLVKVAYAAVNPLEILNITGSVKLIQNYPMPLTLGNELSGTIEKVGSSVVDYKVGDQIYTRLPLEKIGAFAEFVAVKATAVAPIPKNLDLKSSAAVALGSLTAYQGITEELEAKAGQTVLITGASGSFGQLAVPIAKALGLTVIASGNAAMKEKILALGADRYLDYRKENYWEVIEPVDFVIDTLGKRELEHELSIIKAGGRLLSLLASPNKQFAKKQGLPFWKQLLFGAAGSSIDKMAKKHHVDYRFIFVRADGNQLKKITTIVEADQIVPTVHEQIFSLQEVNQALQLVAKGHPQGKVLLKIS